MYAAHARAMCVHALHARVATQHVVDPLMLTEAIRGIILALEDPGLRKKYLAKVTEDLSKVTDATWSGWSSMFQDL